jgi:DNA-binding transcriptional LysR family regulator
MESMNDIHIRRLDVTLLLVVDLLLRKRNMSTTAAELGLTQSAVSHAVSRLRSIFDDPLFIRKGAGVEPTARALQIGPILADALSGIRTAAAAGRHFDAATATRRFVVAAPDPIALAIAAAVLRAFAAAAPRCRLMFRVFNPESAAASVASGEADMAVGLFPNPPSDAVRIAVARDTFNVAARRDHPRIRGPLDLDAYCDLDHLLVSHDPDGRGMVDTVLDGAGRQRRVVGVMPQMLLAFAVVSQTDSILTAPSSACRYARALFPLALHEPPLPLGEIELAILRRRDALADPALNWLAGLIADALSSKPFAE